MHGGSRAALVTAVAIVVLAGCSHGPQLLQPVSGQAGDAVPVTAGESYSFGSLMTCVTGTGHAERIVGVDPVVTRGSMRVVAFGTRPSPFLRQPIGVALGGARGTLDKHGFTTGGEQLVAPCGPKSAATEGEPEATTELALTLVRSGSQTAIAQSLRVRYTSGGGIKTLNVPFTITLCSPADTTTADCRR